MRKYLLLLFIFSNALFSQNNSVVCFYDFKDSSEITKETVRFNKSTQFKVADGCLQTTPPILSENVGETDKWKKSDFSRTNFLNLPKDYSTEFKVYINKPAITTKKSNGVAYIDLGHRCIRLAISTEKTELILENHLLGRDENVSEVLVSRPDIQLQYNTWYTIRTKVYKDETAFWINDVLLYAKHHAITNERGNTFNIDISGAGYSLDYLKIWVEENPVLNR